MISFAKERGVGMAFHYVPLHSSPAGLRYGRVSGGMEVTNGESDRLVRLPLFFGMTQEQRQAVVQVVLDFYAGKQ